MADKIKNRISDAWNSLLHRDKDDAMAGSDREKMVVFAISLFLAFCLWMIVNLNRDYSIGIDIPVELGNVSSDLALAEELPNQVTANISGTGWDLISTYNDPPHIFIDVSKDEINLFEQVRQQVQTTSNITVQKVEPLYLQIKMEPKQSKKVPVRPNVDIQFANQYGLLDDLQIQPDSITIHGASSQIENIDSWPTDSLTLQNIKENISSTVDLKDSNSLISLSDQSIHLQADVEQFTEGEVSVSVETRDFPVGNVVNFSPANVTITYRIPLQEYSSFSRGRMFTAFVNYDQIQQDTTGFVEPQIEKISKKAHAKVRSVKPREVAYFTIIEN